MFVMLKEKKSKYRRFNSQQLQQAKHSEGIVMETSNRKYMTQIILGITAKLTVFEVLTMQQVNPNQEHLDPGIIVSVLRVLVHWVRSGNRRWSE